jgi:hypothetical protein
MPQQNGSTYNIVLVTSRARYPQIEDNTWVLAYDMSR